MKCRGAVALERGQQALGAPDAGVQTAFGRRLGDLCHLPLGLLRPSGVTRCEADDHDGGGTRDCAAAAQ